MSRIIIIGGGFAGVWSAVSAARQLHELGNNSEQVEVSLINRNSFLGIRPRFYERDPQAHCVPLTQILDPVGVRFIEGEVVNIDVDSQKVAVEQEGELLDVTFDRLVFTAGSTLMRPDLPGLHEYAFSTDTYSEAAKLDQHIKRLPDVPEQEGKYTAIVIGGGFTGIEVATEMTNRLKEVAQRENKAHEARVILIEKNSAVGQDFGDGARSIIEKALLDLHVEIRTNQTVRAIDARGITLATGERIASLTTVWSVGVRASRLAACFPVEKETLGRLPVDSFLRVEGLPGIFAAGDTASAKTDGVRVSMMSCQHAIPQGKYAGHNVVCDLMGMEGIPYRQEDYVTCLDLGSWGALYTNGWGRTPVAYGPEANKIKQMINQKISPAEYKERHALFASARPVEFRMNQYETSWR